MTSRGSMAMAVLQVSAAVVATTQLAACLYIAPKEKRRDTRGTIERLPPEPEGPAIPQAWARPVGSSLEITGMWRQQCVQRQVQRVEVRRWNGASFGAWTPCSDPTDGGCFLFMIVGIAYSPVTLAASGIYTAIAIAGDDDIVETSTMELPPHQYQCDRPAPGLNVRLTVPGRPDSFVTLDSKGFMRVELGDPAAAAGATVAVPQ